MLAGVGDRVSLNDVDSMYFGDPRVKVGGAKANLCSLYCTNVPVT